MRLDSAQLAALNSGDAAQLRAAGFPEETVRWLSVGRAFASLQARMKILRPSTETNEKYWKTSPFGFQNRTKEQRTEMAKAQREFSETLRSAFGEEASPWSTDSRLAFLPAGKREQLRQIDQDYSEMQSEIYMDMNGIQLASDREKLKLLQQEKERDLAAALTPEELEQYNLRVSQTAMNLRGRYGDAIQSEEDYRKVYALQKAFDDKYATPDYRAGGPPSAELMRARSEAERVLREQIRAAIGEENYAAFQRANDQSYKALTSLVKRLDLPATTIDTVYASRAGYAAQSQQIAENTALSSAERRSQLQALATKARTELESTLGKEGADAYGQRADWLRLLTNGTGFSTDPKMAPPGYSGGGSVYPVPPKDDAKASPPKT